MAPHRCRVVLAGVLLLLPAVARAQGEWIPPVEGDTASLEHIWTGDVRRTSAGRVAAWVRWVDDHATMVSLYDVDCRTRSAKSLAADLYLTAGRGNRVSTRGVDNKAFAVAPALATTLCGGTRVRALPGTTAGMIREVEPTRWRYLGTGGRRETADSIYVDAETFVKRPGGASAWLKWVHATPEVVDGKTAVQDIVHKEYDCLRRRTRTVRWAQYDSTGRVIAEYGAARSEDWSTPLPATLGEALLRSMCRPSPIPEVPPGQVGPDPE